MSAPARVVAVVLAAGPLLLPRALHAQNEDMCATMGHGCPSGSAVPVKTVKPVVEETAAPTSVINAPVTNETKSLPQINNPIAEIASTIAEDARFVNRTTNKMLMSGQMKMSNSGTLPTTGVGGRVPGNTQPAGGSPDGDGDGDSGQGQWRGGQGRRFPPPDKACSDGTQQCYSEAMLAEMGERIASKFDDIGPMAQKAFGDTKGVDVRPSDLAHAFSYLWREEQGVDQVKSVFGASQWNAIKDDPAKLRASFDTLPPWQQDAIRNQVNQLHEAMTADLMPGGVMNPLHDNLTHEDHFAEIVMQGLNNKPNMPPGSWPSQDPKNPAAWNYDAENALKGGNAQAAAANAQKALELDPENAQAQSVLAAAKYDLKDMSGAAQAANKALELDPNDARAQTVAELAHGLVAGEAKVPNASTQQHNFADVPAGLAGAGAPWRELSVSDEKQRAAISAARDAERALNRGDLSAARAAADRALAANPHSAYAYGLKAFAEIKGGDAEGALRDAVAGLALNPADRMAQKARAQALLKLGRYKEGLLAASAAVAGDPRSAFARYLQAEARAANGDIAGMREALKAAAAMDARYSEMYKASLQVADNGDMAFLFPDLKPGALAAANAAAAASAPQSRNARFLKVAGGAAAGGGLLAWLLWTLFGAKLAPALKTVFTRRGPRVADPSTAAEAPSLEPPAVKDPSLLRGQYKTLRQIGVGGMGMVYEGTDVSLGRRVAIKKMREELRLDRRQRERFVSEAKTVAALHHPNVVDIYAIVDDSDELYLIFEYVTGKTLHEMVHGRGPLPFDEARRLYRGVGEALEYAHARGVIHRDLKPSNIMIDEEGRPKVMDFGIARAAKDAMTRYSMTNTVVGTPPYMAPEQEQGVVRKESDVFALAVCFYETVTGTLPFAGSGGGMVMNKINKAFVPASRVVAGLPEGLDEVFDKAFEPDPDKRYRTVAELRAALEALAPSAAARA